MNDQPAAVATTAPNNMISYRLITDYFRQAKLILKAITGRRGASSSNRVP